MYASRSERLPPFRMWKSSACPFLPFFFAMHDPTGNAAWCLEHYSLRPPCHSPQMSFICLALSPVFPPRPRSEISCRIRKGISRVLGRFFFFSFFPVVVPFRNWAHTAHGIPLAQRPPPTTCSCLITVSQSVLEGFLFFPYSRSLSLLEDPSSSPFPPPLDVLRPPGTPIGIALFSRVFSYL